jgi:uncharacterized protein
VFVLELALTDDPRRLAARPAHRELVARQREQGVVVMAGPFADGTGAFVVFDVPDAAALARVVAEDAYYVTPGVTVVRQVEWTPIVS